VAGGLPHKMKNGLKRQQMNRDRQLGIVPAARAGVLWRAIVLPPSALLRNGVMWVKVD